MAIALTAGAQTSAPAPDASRFVRSSGSGSRGHSAPAQATPATGGATAAPTWSVGPHGSEQGYIDGYYSFNFNRPNTSLGYFDQINQLYNFNDKTDQFELSAAKLTLNHSPDPIGAHVDFHPTARTNDLINNAASNTTTTTFVASRNFLTLEQAYLSIAPPKAKGFELDFGKWVTFGLAGAEVIEAKEQLELLAFPALCERHSLLALSARVPRSLFRRPRLLAFSCSTAGITSPNRTEASQGPSPALL